MVTNDRYQEFSDRLNATLDYVLFPPKGKARATKLGAIFDVGQKGARKWLEGEAIPKQTRHQTFIEELNKLGAEITGEWLFFGNSTAAPQWYRNLMNLNDAYQGRYAVESNVKDGPEIKGKVPLINYVQAGAWKEIMDVYEPVEWIETTITVSSKSFALRVIGDSMTNPVGSPSIPDGFIVIVDPELQPQHGSIVVARLENSNEAMLKQLIIDGPHRYLKPLNPNYRTIEINENCAICGVAKKVQYDL